jgi:tight adherence protein C
MDATPDRRSPMIVSAIGGIRRRRSIEAALGELPDLVELLVVSVRAGCAPAAAVGVVIPHASASLRPILHEVEHRLRRGNGFADALAAFTDALGAPAAAFVDSLATADRYGLPIQPVLDRLADDIRAERRAAAERQARTLPVRLAFPLVTCILPSFVLLAIAPAVIGALSTLRGTSP